MLVAWKHPETPMLDEPSWRAAVECNDESRPLGVVTFVDPEAYVHFVDGVEWCFAEKADGTIVHVRRSECAEVEQDRADRGGDDDSEATSVPDRQAGVEVAGAGEEGDHEHPTGG